MLPLESQYLTLTVFLLLTPLVCTRPLSSIQRHTNTHTGQVLKVGSNGKKTCTTAPVVKCEGFKNPIDFIGSAINNLGNTADRTKQCGTRDHWLNAFVFPPSKLVHGQRKVVRACMSIFVGEKKKEQEKEPTQNYITLFVCFCLFPLGLHLG